MDTRRISSLAVSIFLILGLAACGSVPGRTPDLPAATLALSSPTPLASATPSALPSDTPLAALPTATLDCTNNLLFIFDVTIPDGTVVAPGTLLDKQWLVQNAGSCNWDERYRLRLIDGNALGAGEQSLYPALAGAQVTLRIEFTAPAEAGDYVSEWQAFDPEGNPFGDSFFIKISVQP